MTENKTAALDQLTKAFFVQSAGVQKRRISFGYAERKAALTRLHHAIRTHESALIRAMKLDLNKPETEAVVTEIIPVLDEIKHTMRHMKRWMKAKYVAPTLVTFGTKARIKPEARGVCLIISPWNYPMSLALGPLISAIAAGNSAMIKPSEFTPATSSVIAQIVVEAFSPELVTVIEGGVEVSQALLELPFDHIFFTGSPAVGKIVMAAAAKTLASVTLELGGKSPMIIGPDADIKNAAKWISFGKFANNGQSCIAPDHVFVHASIKQAFTKALRARIKKAYGTDAQSPHLASDVSERHAARLVDLFHDAKVRGAKVVFGGDTSHGRISPTVVEAITPEMTIDHEEIFGPILPIIEYSDIGEVIARINERSKPLALYIFDQAGPRVDHIIAATSSGSVGVNLTMAQFTHLGLPFGGVGGSGMGSAHGVHGFRAFSHERAILVNKFSLLPLIFPPYTKRVKAIVAMIKRLIG